MGYFLQEEQLYFYSLLAVLGESAAELWQNIWNYLRAVKAWNFKQSFSH